MSLPESPAGTLRLIGGRLCLDFVNTVGGRRTGLSRKKLEASEDLVLNEKLNDYIDLVAWSQHTGVVTETEAQRLIREGRRLAVEAARVLKRALRLREAIYRTLRALVGGWAPRQSDLDILNDELFQARGQERLTRVGSRFTWECSINDELDWMLWPVVLSAAELLTTGDFTRLRECGGQDCGWLFEDTSRNRSRQWCYMEGCGNLSKVRRFRSRMRMVDSKSRSPQRRKGR